jgi:hypothetical protein
MSLTSACRFALLGSWLAAACTREPSATDSTSTRPAPSAPVPESAAWLLDGGADDRFVRVAKQLRGFDAAMVEVGYRYSELYWAGKDENWDYATYQIEKIETAIANGIERRPKRAASARMLDGALAPVKEAIGRHDASAFDSSLAALTNTCNACHQAERVPFIHVAPPRVRLAPVVSPAARDGGPP